MKQHLKKTDKLLAQFVAVVYGIFWPRAERLKNSAIVATREWRQQYLRHGLPFPWFRESGGPARRRQMIDRRALVHAGYATSAKPGHLQLTPAGEFRARALMGMSDWDTAKALLGRMEVLVGTACACRGFVVQDFVFLRSYCERCRESHWMEQMETMLPLLARGLVEATDGLPHVQYRRTDVELDWCEERETALPPEAYCELFNDAYVATWRRILSDLAAAEPDNTHEIYVPPSCSATDGTLAEIEAAIAEFGRDMDRSPHDYIPAAVEPATEAEHEAIELAWDDAEGQP